MLLRDAWGGLPVGAMFYILERGMPGLGSCAALAAPGVVLVMLVPVTLGRAVRVRPN